MKKTVWGIAVLCLTACILIPKGVRAWFTDQEHKINPFTIGINTLIPDEPFDPPTPGEKTVKKPQAVNTGSIPCYVRGRIMVSDSRALEYLRFLSEGAEGLNTESWTEASDGWLYLTKVLEPGASSAAVFDEILLDQEIPEEMKGFTIDVVFESVQCESFENAEEAFQAVAAVDA